jgi:hypothetical protein
MADQNLRIYPVQGDGYGDAIEYPAFAKYRMEPDYPGAAGDKNHHIVVYELDDKREEVELGRHDLSDHLVVFAGQPSPFRSEGTVPSQVNKAAASTTTKKGSSTTSSSK